MATQKLYAHYWATAKTKTVTISTDIQGRNVTLKKMVSGKKEARTYAASKSATPWNF